MRVPPTFCLMELLKVSQLTQHFGAVPALADVNFTLEPGEVLGVVGQRGAGKSTLFKLLSGVYIPSSGDIAFAGKRVVFNTVSQAQQLGIMAVQQQTQLVDSMNVLHNVFLGREIRGLGGLKRLPQEAQMLQATRELLTAFDMSPDLAEECVANLSDEQRQVVALARALCHPCRLLLLDNALAALNFARQRLLLEAGSCPGQTLDEYRRTGQVEIWRPLLRLAVKFDVLLPRLGHRPDEVVIHQEGCP